MRFKTLCVDNVTYRDVELTFLPHGLVQVTGWRSQLVQRDYDCDFYYGCARVDPNDYPDWPKQLVQTWWDWLLGRPGTMEYDFFHDVKESYNFVIHTSKIGKGVLKDGR